MDFSKMGFKESTGFFMAMTIVLGWTYWSYVYFYNTLVCEYLVFGMIALSFIPQIRDIIGTARVTVLHTPTDIVWNTGLRLMPTPLPFFHMWRIEVPFGLILEKEYYPDQKPLTERIDNSPLAYGGVLPINLGKDTSGKVLAINTVARFGNNMLINPNEVRLKFVKMYYWILIPYFVIAVTSKILANNFEMFSSYTFITPTIGKCVTLPKGEKVELWMPRYPVSFTTDDDSKVFSINENKFWMMSPNWKQVLEILPKTAEGNIYKSPIKVVLSDGENQSICF